MPYKKRYNKKKYNNNGYLSKASTAAGVAAKALRVAYYTKKMLNVEYKLIDVAMNA